MVIYIIILLILLVFIILWQNVSKKGSDKAEIIKTLIRQASRWSVAAQQNGNAMIAVLHANYGAGYLWALESIALSSEIEAATGIDYVKLRDTIIQVQDNATRKLAALCPGYLPNTELARIAGEA